MLDHIKFLEERYQEVKKKVVSSPDYKEMKALEVVLSRMEKTEEPKLPDKSKLNIIYEPSGQKRDGGNTHKEHDPDNSPAKNIRWGERMARTYDLVEKVVIENNGIIDFKVLIDHLTDVHDLHWDDKGEGPTQTRIVSYIQMYNKNNPHDIRLHLLPERAEGVLKIRKYEQVVYVGKQRVAK